MVVSSTGRADGIHDVERIVAIPFVHRLVAGAAGGVGLAAGAGVLPRGSASGLPRPPLPPRPPRATANWKMTRSPARCAFPRLATRVSLGWLCQVSCASPVVTSAL